MDRVLLQGGFVGMMGLAVFRVGALYHGHGGGLDPWQSPPGSPPSLSGLGA